MAEQEYVNVTNIAKINVSIKIIADTLFDEGSNSEKVIHDTLKALYSVVESIPINSD